MKRFIGALLALFLLCSPAQAEIVGQSIGDIIKLQVIGGVDSDSKFQTFRFDSSGNLLTSGGGGGGGGTEYTEGATDSSITGSAILWEDTSDTLRAVSAAKPLPTSLYAGTTALTTGTGAVDAGTLRVTLGTSAVSAVNAVGPAAHDAAASGNPLLQGGYASDTAPSDVTDGDVVRAWRLRNGAAATVLTAAGAKIGGDATNGLDVDVTRMSASATGGADAYRNASFTEANAKASAGTLYAVTLTETSGNVRYVQVYNTSSTPTNGSSTVIFTLPLAGFDNKFFEFGTYGLALGTGISFGCTTDAAGTTDATAGHCLINAVYK